MKPAVLPDALKDAWQDFPRFEILHAESGMTITRLRDRLKKVPCFRCPDKSVRYEPAAARAAMYDEAEDEDEDDEVISDEELSAIDGDAFKTKSGLLGLLALVFREQVRSNAETRKERQDTVRVMQGPLETGLKLQADLNATIVKRLEHLESMWDRMVLLSEDMIAAQHLREAEAHKRDESIAMRKRAMEMLDRHGPMILNKWTLTREAQLSLEFLAGLDPRIIEYVKSADVLTPEQIAILTQLGDAISRRKKAAKPPAEDAQRDSQSQDTPNNHVTPTAS